MKILSYGATGSQGAPVARRLLENGHQVRVMLRHPDKAESLKTMGAEVVQGDLGDLPSVLQANRGIKAVFIMLPFGSGGNPVQMFQNALQAAKEAGVGYIVFNISGQTPKEPTGLPMLDYRIALEQMLGQSGIPSVILRPTAYMENLLGPWTLPTIQARDVVAYPVAANRPLSWVASEDVAALAVAALEHPQLAASVFDVGGPEALTGARIAESFSTALSRPIRYEAISPEAFGAMMAGIMGPEAGEATTKAYQVSEATPLEAMSINMQPVLEKLPVRLTTLESWVRQHAPAFSAAAKV